LTESQRDSYLRLKNGRKSIVLCVFEAVIGSDSVSLAVGGESK